jgi:hypothetical protein
MYTKEMAQENREMLARAKQLILKGDYTPLNHRTDKDRLLDTMGHEFPNISADRRKNAVVRAIRHRPH